MADGEGRLNEWRARLATLDRGEMSVAEWCAHEQVSKWQYRYWRHRVSKLDSGGDAAPRFVPVSLSGPDRFGVGGTGVSVRIGCATIDVDRGFDAAVLRAVVSALSGSSC